MATITVHLEKADRGKGFMSQKRRERIKLARGIKRLISKYGDSWIYYYSAGDTVSFTGDDGDFDEAREV